MRRLRVLLIAALIASSCAGDSRQHLPTAPSISADSPLSSGLRTVEPEHLGEADDLAADTSLAAADLAAVEFEELGTTATGSFTLSGIVSDKVVATWKIANAKVTITPGIPATFTNALGKYTAKLSARSYTIKVTATGYATATVTKALKTTSTLNFTLAPIKPAGATARCKDRTWSFSKNRSGTCSSHKGVQYWVCPGLLCEPPPPPPPPPPPGCGPRSAPCGAATAVCRDGTLSCSQNRSGTCSYHGGVACWICPGRLCATIEGPAVGKLSRAFLEAE